MRRFSSAAQESSPPKRHFSSFVFSEGASPDAPIFFSAVRRTALKLAVFSFRRLSEGASLMRRFSSAAQESSPPMSSLPMRRLFSFWHLSEGSSPDEPICYSCQFGCSGEQPSECSLTLQVNRRFAPPPSSGQGYIAQFSPSVQVCRRGFGAATMSAQR